MALTVKQVGDGVQVEDGGGRWLLFTLDELRSHSALVRADMVCGTPPLPEREADLFAWAAYAAARGYAAQHGLIAGA